MSFSIKLGNFLYRNAFFIYKPLYSVFKKRQDAFEISLLKKYISEGNNVLDIGANIGFYASVLSDIVGPKGQVHCFEPDSTNFQYLKKKCGGLKNVVLINKAVGPKTETIKIYTSKEMNVDHRTYKPEDYESELEIPAISIDDYIQGKKVDFIKMDIQGFEMEALKGMIKTLEQNRELNLITEFWPYGLNRAGSSATEYFDLLSELGFNCYLLKKNTLSKLDTKKVMSLEKLSNDKKFYFNIFASRKDV